LLRQLTMWLRSEMPLPFSRASLPTPGASVEVFGRRFQVQVGAALPMWRKQRSLASRHVMPGRLANQLDLRPTSQILRHSSAGMELPSLPLVAQVRKPAAAGQSVRSSSPLASTFVTAKTQFSSLVRCNSTTRTILTPPTVTALCALLAGRTSWEQN